VLFPRVFVGFSGRFIRAFRMVVSCRRMQFGIFVLSLRMGMRSLAVVVRGSGMMAGGCVMVIV